MLAYAHNRSRRVLKTYLCSQKPDLLNLIELVFHESIVYLISRFAHPDHSIQFNLIYSV